MTDFVSCEWCGSDNWEEYELDNGKCKMCVVNDCRHTNTDVASHELFLYSNNPRIIVDYVCLDCELCWTKTFKLENGVRSKLTHEDVNTSDIWQDVKV